MGNQTALSTFSGQIGGQQACLYLKICSSFILSTHFVPPLIPHRTFCSWNFLGNLQKRSGAKATFNAGLLIQQPKLPQQLKHGDSTSKLLLSADNLRIFLLLKFADQVYPQIISRRQSPYEIYRQRDREYANKKKCSEFTTDASY